MPRLDLSVIPETNRTGYPGALADAVAGRWYRRLGPAGGLTDIGVSHVRLEPGAWSSQRHWHAGEDEFVVIVAGEAVLVEEGARTPMRPGDCAAFPKGAADGHHLVNEGDVPCLFIAVGSNGQGAVFYPDIDLVCTASGTYVRRDGTPVEGAAGAARQSA